MTELDMKDQLDRITLVTGKKLSKEEYRLFFEKLSGFSKQILSCAIDVAIVEAKRPTISFLQKTCFDILRQEKIDQQRLDDRAITDIVPDRNMIPKFKTPLEAINWVEGFRVKCVDALKPEKQDKFFDMAQQYFSGEVDVCFGYKKALRQNPSDWEPMAQEYARLSTKAIVGTCLRLAIS